MSTNYEFKDMATIDLVEAVAENANVLIEEGGVIKRAPKSEVGGGTASSLAYDAVISIAANPYMTPEFTTSDVSVNTSEILNVVQKMVNNEIVNVIIKYNYSYGGNSYIVSTPASLSCRSEGTTDTNDNILTVAFILYNYYENPYSIIIRFSTVDGTCVFTGYKTFNIS